MINKENNNPSIVVQQQGKEPISLNQEQIIQHLNQQNQKINELVVILKQRDETILNLQHQIDNIKNTDNSNDRAGYSNNNINVNEIRTYIDYKIEQIENKIDKIINLLEYKPKIKGPVINIPNPYNFNLQLKKN